VCFFIFPVFLLLFSGFLSVECSVSRVYAAQPAQCLAFVMNDFIFLFVTYGIQNQKINNESTRK